MTADRFLARWTPEEDARLRARFHGCSLAELAALLPRHTTSGVVQRAGKLGLRRGTPPAWTPAEDAVLRELYPSAGAKGVAKRLPGRSLSGIYQRARTIGITAARSPA